MELLELWQEGCRAFDAREYSAAWEAVQQLIEKEPRHLEAHLLAGQVAVIRRQWRQAVVSFRKASRLQSDNSLTILLLAAAEIEGGFISTAYDRLSNWERPDNQSEEKIAFGETEFSVDSWQEELLARCRQFLRDDQRLRNRLLQKGDQYRELHRIEKSIACYRVFLEFDPESYKAHFGLGEAYRESRQDREALEAYSCAVENAPDEVEPRKKLGLTYIRLGEREKAADIWRSIIEQHPEEKLVAHYLDNLSPS